MTEKTLLVTPVAPPQLPSIQSLLLESPLYARHKFVSDDHGRKMLTSLRQMNFQIDAHCIHCKRESVFKTNRSLAVTAGRQTEPEWMFKDGDWEIVVICARNPTHKYSYWFQTLSQELMKLGQWPSLEDIAGADIEKYRSQLKGGYFTELKMATGLASHGIGIGSFVYLRRIFERLIYQHHEELLEKVDDFDKMRMDEKIGALKKVLPPALVANKATYAILSKGLHELDEKTCKLYFPVVRSAIIRILEQDFQAREQAQAETALTQEIAKIASQLK